MEIVFTWMEQYITIFLLFAVMSYLIPKETYEKYIKFFMQLVFVLLLAAPIFSFLFQGKANNGEAFYRSFVKEMEQREREAETLSFLDEDYMEFVTERVTDLEREEAAQGGDVQPGKDLQQENDVQPGKDLQQENDAQPGKDLQQENDAQPENDALQEGET